MKKKLLTLIMIMTTLLVITGCSNKKEVDYSNATENSPEEQQAPAMEEEIPEHWTYTSGSGAAFINVDADIIVPENYSKCTIMEFTKDDFKDEDIRSMADKIFDEGSHFLCMPYNDESITYVMDKMTSLYAISTDVQERYAFENVLENFDFEAEKAFNYPKEVSEESYEEYKFYKVYEREEITGIGDIYCCEIFGTIDGKCYVLTFIKNNTNCKMKLIRWNTAFAFVTSNLKENSLYVNLDGNECFYSKEEAENIAREYVKMLGYEDFDIMRTCNVRKEVWNSAVMNQETVVDGYNVYLSRKYNDYSIIFNSSLFTPYENYQNSPMFYVMDGDVSNYDVEGNEYIKVYVDNDGVCQLYINNPMTKKGVMTENAVMLPFDSICQTAREQFDDMCDIIDGRLNISEIELGYDYVRDANNIALVPTWFFFEKNVNQEDRRYPILKINAIDGSVMNQTFVIK